MSGKDAGLGVFDYVAFAKETYGLGSDDKKSSSRQSENQNSSSRSLDGGENSGTDHSDRDSNIKKGSGRSQPRHKKSQDDDHQSDTYNYSNQGYRAAPSRHPQGDPNFYNPSRRSRQPVATLDGPSDNTRGHADDRFWVQQGRVESPPMQQDPYYPPPPGQNYHRYNPADYQPQSYNNGGSSNAYATSRYQEPYGRPDSANANNRSSDDRRSRDDRRERRRKSRRSTSRSRSQSGDGGELRKKFDTSKEGLTTGAIGALAGGLIANEVGKNPLVTLAGVVLGGLGANVWEARDAKKKSERERSRSRPRQTKSDQKSSRRARSEQGRGKDSSRDRNGRRSSVFQGGNGDYNSYDRGNGGNNDGYNGQQSSRGVGGGGRDYDGRDGGGYGGGYGSGGSGTDSEAEERERRRRKKEKKRQKEKSAEGGGDMSNKNDPGPWGEVLKW